MGTVILLSALLLATSFTTIVNSTPILGGSHYDSGIQVGSSSVTSTASTTTAEPTSEDTESESTGDGQNTGTTARSTSPSEAPTEDTKSTSTGDGHTTETTTASTSPPEPEDATEVSNDTITTPADADPYDCRNATQKGHIFLSCSYGCEGDEMLMALNNATCYLYPPNGTNTLILNKTYNPTEPNSNETGICFNGDCIPRPTNDSAFPTQAFPDQSSTTPTAEDQTQGSNDTVTTPADADPYDCRNATQKGHIFLSCSYGCGGDEMVTALDNATCYLYPPNVTTAILLSGLYNYTEYHTNKTGVCWQGDCIPKSGETTETTTEPPPTENTSPENPSETENPINEPSVMTEKPNDLSEPSSESLPNENTSAEHVGSTEDTNADGGSDSDQVKGPSSIPGEESPEALPALT